MGSGAGKAHSAGKDLGMNEEVVWVIRTWKTLVFFWLGLLLHRKTVLMNGVYWLWVFSGLVFG